jgi:hypothetical protein
MEFAKKLIVNMKFMKELENSSKICNNRTHKDCVKNATP